MVYMLLAEGFEEIEAIAPLDLMRRADIEVSTVSLTEDFIVQGGHGICAQADVLLCEIDFNAMEMLVLPGGLGGVDSIAGSQIAMDLIVQAWNAKKKLAAICAAPSLLAKLGILDGLAVTCHPGVHDKIVAAGGKLQAELPAVSDRNLITGKAAGASIDFGLELVAAMRDRETAEKLRRAVFY